VESFPTGCAGAGSILLIVDRNRVCRLKRGITDFIAVPENFQHRASRMWPRSDRQIKIPAFHRIGRFHQTATARVRSFAYIWPMHILRMRCLLSRTESSGFSRREDQAAYVLPRPSFSSRDFRRAHSCRASPIFRCLSMLVNILGSP